MEIIIGKTAGFCYGVKRAVDGALEESKKNKKTYCLGELVHNKEVIEDLKNKGIKIIEDINEAKDKNKCFGKLYIKSIFTRWSSIRTWNSR